jgi:sporulation protein YlmC with PRC-barrel domain
MVIVAVFRISAIVDVRERITKLLVGLPIYDSGGKWLGRVENIDKKKNSIVYVDGKTDSPIYVAKGKFTVRRGRLVLSSSA